MTLITELAEVFVREKFARRIRAAQVSAPEVVADFAQLAPIVVPAEIDLPCPATPTTIKCWRALGAQADLIVSRDGTYVRIGDNETLLRSEEMILHSQG